MSFGVGGPYWEKGSCAVEPVEPQTLSPKARKAMLFWSLTLSESKSRVGPVWESMDQAPGHDMGIPRVQGLDLGVEGLTVYLNPKIM